MTVALASCDWVDPGLSGNLPVIAALGRRGIPAVALPWTDPVDWADFDLVVIRSTWDYTARHREFLDWVRGLPVPVRNIPELVAWNSDKRYLADLSAAGVPAVPTVYVGPGDPPPDLAGEVVVKPSVSAGARATGRFGPASHEEARRLIAEIADQGKTAMVQPFMSAPDEAAVVLIDGELSHTLRKGPVLRPDEVAPISEPGGPADVMREPGLVRAGTATGDEQRLAAAIADYVRTRFGAVPLYLRVDQLTVPGNRPVLLELEAVEPSLYFDLVPQAADRMAAAIDRTIRTAR
jgi:glutathione synthase/RimK-type ligase-like ATP-grasp enzyme